MTIPVLRLREGARFLKVTTVVPRLSVPTASSIARLFSRTYELSDEKGRLTPMEGLRGMAVLLVFFVHFDAMFAIYARGKALLLLPTHFLGLVGNAGVDLFFVLSGYLIYAALIRHKQTTLSFMRRRVERIYPTFLAVFGFYLVLSFVLPSVSRLRGLSWPEALVYLAQNLLLLPGVFDIKPLITVAWSLSYELFFYLIATLIVYATCLWNWKQSSRIMLFVGIGLGYFGFCFTLSKSHVRALMFVVGILLYEGLSSERFRRILSRRGEVLAIVVFVASLIYAYLLDTHYNLFTWLPAWWAGREPALGVGGYQGPYKTLAFAISMFWCTAYCCSFDGLLRRVFSWTPLRYLGNMSYSYYLIHGVTLQGVALIWHFMAAPHGAAQVPVFFVTLVAAFAATWASSTILFVAVEKKFSLKPGVGIARGAVAVEVRS
jgi:exopolysaccharide production protein ExoZ